MYEYEHFQNSHNSLIFQSANEHDGKINNVCSKFKYPSAEVHTAGFADHLNLLRQRVNSSLFVHG
jgi:hypothetical protein